MFHVIKARLDRLARKLAAVRDGQVNEYASWYGWSAVQVSRGTWCYRDPRFTQLKMDRLGLVTGCDHCDAKVADWISNGVLEGMPVRRSWAQAAVCDRIQGLDLPARYGKTVLVQRKVQEAARAGHEVTVVDGKATGWWS